MENVEVDTKGVHNLYQSFVNSGMAFGAVRWLSTLQRQCERIASVLANNVPSGDSTGKHSKYFAERKMFQEVSVRIKESQVLNFYWFIYNSWREKKPIKWRENMYIYIDIDRV